MATANGAMERTRRLAREAERELAKRVKRARKSGEEAIETAEELGEELWDGGGALVRKVESTISNRPITSVLIAAVAGFLVAKVWRS